MRPSRRGGRVAEGARLESVFTGNRNVGSNPTPSAKSFLFKNYYSGLGARTSVYPNAYPNIEQVPAWPSAEVISAVQDSSAALLLRLGFVHWVRLRVPQNQLLNVGRHGAVNSRRPRHRQELHRRPTPQVQNRGFTFLDFSNFRHRVTFATLV